MLPKAKLFALVLAAALNAGVAFGNADDDLFNAINENAGKFNVTALEALLKKGANVNARDKNGNTPLMLWSNGGSTQDTKMIKALIRAGADVNARSSSGWNALMFAACNQSLYSKEIISCLLRAGADINAQDKNGETALMCAAIEEVENEAYTFLNMALLIREGADIFIKDSDGDALFDYYDVNSHEPDNGDTLLMLMCKIHTVCSADIIANLIKAGADVNYRNEGRQTPLMYIAENYTNPYSYEIAKLLISHSADVSAEDYLGFRVIDYAHDDKMREILQKKD